jgi:hypothetical protein
MNRFPAILFAFFHLSLFTLLFSAAGAGHKVQASDFGKTSDGVSVSRDVLTNNKGVEAAVITYGATLVSLGVPDRAGKSEDVVLGYGSVQGYEQGKSYFGGTIGRYGKRKSRPTICASHRPLPRDAAFSGFAESSKVSVHGFEARRNVPDVDSFGIFDAEITQQHKVEGECG